jgi:hypothetical protein
VAHPRTTKPLFRRALMLAASGAGVVTLAAGGLVAGAGPAAAADTATINGATTFHDHRVRRLGGVRPGADRDERLLVRPAAGARPALQPGVGGRPDDPAQLDQRGLRVDDRAEQPRRAERGAHLPADVSDQPGRGPALVRPADQGRLRRDQRVRRRVERPGVHEDQRLVQRRRGGLRRAICELLVRRLAAGVRELPRAVREGLRGRRGAAELHRPGERGQPVHQLRQHADEPRADGELPGRARAGSGLLGAAGQDGVLRHRGLGLRAAVRRRDRSGPDGAGGHLGLHQG